MNFTGIFRFDLIDINFCILNISTNHFANIFGNFHQEFYTIQQSKYFQILIFDMDLNIFSLINIFHPCKKHILFDPKLRIDCKILYLLYNLENSYFDINNSFLDIMNTVRCDISYNFL